MNATRINDALAQVEPCVIAALGFMQREGFESFDYYDWWATGWGQRAKQLAYRTEPLGNLLFSAPILACEWWLPFLRRPLGIRKRLYPISVAHHGLVCLKLHSLRGEPELLKQARKDADLLLTSAVPSDKGPSWGFPFAWSTNKGIIPPSQPAATQTSYCLDLLEGLWEATHEQRYLTAVLAVARAMDEEYLDLRRRAGVASTYHGRGYGDVIANAISYRVHILARAVASGADCHKGKLMALIEYLLDQQQDNGSWLYGESSKNRFIDHYHTCFVIKNLERANRVLGIPDVAEAVARAVGFYWSNLFDERGMPKPFAQAVRLNVVRYESYDFAECLGLFSLFGPSRGFTRERLNPILGEFLARFRMRSGALRFRVYRVPTTRGYPYYRFGMTAGVWALAQLMGSRLLDEGAAVD